MRKQESRLWFSTVRVIAAVIFILGFGRAGSAGLFAGGGKRASDCYAEFNVKGTAAGTNKLTCVDGDPACDSDGLCQGTCTFSLSVCVNQSNVVGCSPKPFKKPLRVTGGVSGLSVVGSAAPACGPESPVELTLKGKKNKARKKKIKLTAIVTGKPSKEVDQLTLTCKPRVGACPTTTTTTTTPPTTIQLPTTTTAPASPTTT